MWIIYTRLLETVRLVRFQSDQLLYDYTFLYGTIEIYHVQILTFSLPLTKPMVPIRMTLIKSNSFFDSDVIYIMYTMELVEYGGFRK